MMQDPAGLARIPQDVIVVGASAGGVAPLRRLVSALPADLPAAIFIVLHIQPHQKSLLPELLSYAGPLSVAHAIEGEPIQPGRVYIAPPDRHLIVESDRVHLSAGPRENFARPAIDPLFRSAALAYGPRVIGVILSGTLTDGTAGLWEIKQRGGTAIVQHPGDAPYPAMPQNAMRQVPVDYVLPVSEIPALLIRLAGGPLYTAWESPKPAQATEPDAETRHEGELAMQDDRPKVETVPDDKPGSPEVKRDMAAQAAGQRDGEVTVYSCPECGGSLWQVNAGQMPRFRCRVGHVYSAENLLEGYTDDLERSLWYAVRTLRDKANLNRQLATDAREWGHTELADRYAEKARQDDEHSATIERMIARSTEVVREQ
jgi:two-component system, chemotaxis family, protein-glutamate methylesterase/glutaminase